MSPLVLQVGRSADEQPPACPGWGRRAAAQGDRVAVMRRLAFSYRDEHVLMMSRTETRWRLSPDELLGWQLRLQMR